MPIIPRVSIKLAIVSDFRNPILSELIPQQRAPIMINKPRIDEIDPASAWDIPSVSSIVTNTRDNVLTLVPPMS